jgi:hypothetical protein
MVFSIDCSCGKAITVTAAQAGTEVRCDCGQVNAVPLLSELRRSAGQSKYNLGITDRIRQQVADGALPAEDACARCGVQTSDALQLLVECERTWTAGGGFWKHFLLFLLAPFWIWGLLRRDYNNPEVFGRENVVNLPLRMCRTCQITVRQTGSNAAIIALLQEVPLYQELLREYPQAKVVSSAGR